VTKPSNNRLKLTPTSVSSGSLECRYLLADTQMGTSCGLVTESGGESISKCHEASGI